MNSLIYRIRIKTANLLVRLANRIRPSEVTNFMKMVEDQFKYGSGFMRIDPKEIYKND